MELANNKMSATYHIFCPETKKQVWVGQGTRADLKTLYDDSQLVEFLETHRGMALYYGTWDDCIEDEEGRCYNLYSFK